MPAKPANLPALMADMAGHFAEALANVAGATRQAPPALPAVRAGLEHSLSWENIIFTAPSFRRAHLEMFSVPGQFAVLHLCILPHLSDPAPIFGFDMLGGRDQVSGLFLDFSPVVSQSQPSLGEAIDGETRAACGTPRPVPAWGTIFSPAFLAVRPRGLQDVETGLAAALAGLRFYLTRLAHMPAAPPRRDAILAGQTAYALAQRANPHTARMLARFVGAAGARTVIETLLFPITTPEAAKRLDRAA